MGSTTATATTRQSRSLSRLQHSRSRRHHNRDTEVAGRRDLSESSSSTAASDVATLQGPPRRRKTATIEFRSNADDWVKMGNDAHSLSLSETSASMDAYSTDSQELTSKQPLQRSTYRQKISNPDPHPDDESSALQYSGSGYPSPYPQQYHHSHHHYSPEQQHLLRVSRYHHEYDQKYDDDYDTPVTTIPAHVTYGDWRKQNMRAPQSATGAHSSTAHPDPVPRSGSPVSNVSDLTSVGQSSSVVTPLHSTVSRYAPSLAPHLEDGPNPISPDQLPGEEHQSILSDEIGPTSGIQDFQTPNRKPTSPPQAIDFARTPSAVSVASNATARVINTGGVPPKMDDNVLVRVGNREFKHSRTMLSYASKVLERYFQQPDQPPELSIPKKQGKEWEALLPFLQPRSVQAASITPKNLPPLLPWFEQLGLTVLLRECDTLLSKLEFAQNDLDDSNRTPPPLSDAAAQTLACAPLGVTANRHIEQHRASNESPTPDAAPQSQDVVDIMLLTRITGKAYLPLTREMALRVLNYYLSLPHLFLTNEDEDGQFSVDLLEALAVLMKDREVRETLWFSLSRYLPSDMVTKMDQEMLVNNALFPFLLREGLLKKVELEKLSQDCCGTMQGPRLSGPALQALKLGESVVENSFLAECFMDDDDLYEEEDREAAAVFSSWQTSWDNWLGIWKRSASTVEDTETVGSSPIRPPTPVATGVSWAASFDSGSSIRASTKRTVYSNDRPMRNYSDRRGFQVQESSRSKWLTAVWTKLCEPPIMGDHTVAPPASPRLDPDRKTKDTTANSSSTSKANSFHEIPRNVVKEASPAPVRQSVTMNKEISTAPAIKPSATMTSTVSSSSSARTFSC